MTETVTRKRIEILADTPLVPRVVTKLKQAGVSGWSVLHVDSGGGRHGEWQHDDVTAAAAKAIVLAIASEERTQAVIDALAPFLDSYGLLLLVSDVQVIRGERF